MRRTVSCALVIAALAAQPACEKQGPISPDGVGSGGVTQINQPKANSNQPTQAQATPAATATPTASPEKYSHQRKELLARVHPPQQAAPTATSGPSFPLRSPANSDAGAYGGGGERVSATVPTDDPPPAISASPVPIRPRRHIAGGVLNGKAQTLPKPEYPATAKTAGASGVVTVQVLVDETGRVITARAISGHPTLREAAERAASRASFSPTVLSGQPVKVTGVITYNFVLQ